MWSWLIEFMVGVFAFADEGAVLDPAGRVSAASQLSSTGQK